MVLRDLEDRRGTRDHPKRVDERLAGWLALKGEVVWGRPAGLAICYNIAAVRGEMTSRYAMRPMHRISASEKFEKVYTCGQCILIVTETRYFR